MPRYEFTCGSREKSFEMTPDPRGASQRHGSMPELRKRAGHPQLRTPRQAGGSEHVGMTVTGQKTRPVFDRYDIVSPADLQETARKADGHILGHSSFCCCRLSSVTR
jgi:hypothetical protein